MKPGFLTFAQRALCKDFNYLLSEKREIAEHYGTSLPAATWGRSQEELALSKLSEHLLTCFNSIPICHFYCFFWSVTCLSSSVLSR